MAPSNPTAAHIMQGTQVSVYHWLHLFQPKNMKKYVNYSRPQLSLVISWRKAQTSVNISLFWNASLRQRRWARRRVSFCLRPRQKNLVHSAGVLDAALESHEPSANKIATRTSSLPGTNLQTVMCLKYSMHSKFKSYTDNTSFALTKISSLLITVNILW